MSVQRLAIIGLGLIGGSFARAVLKAGVVHEVIGYDVDPARVAAAIELGVATHAADSLEAAVRDADVVLLSVPVLQTREVLSQLASWLRDDAILTDVGSTKVSVQEDVAAVFGVLPARFVGGHPVAGNEKSGVEASFAELFQGRRCILTPHEGQDPAALATVRALWEAAGSVVCEMSAEHHDEVLAATSHLPHVLAFALVDFLNTLDSRKEIFAYAAGGFRDFTRIASSSPKMWHDITRANRAAVLGALDGYLGELQKLRDAITDDDGPVILDIYTRARDARERYLELVERPAATKKS
ncbi:prephenate dehydrogenase/arogenate dehydrogenase family protein [Solimonas sp. K1W22B-7]|uniref:prephenate dehydrogenase n=1 Tax=Solimonas sp. K1W22B-7 TaxID=2303331 RepID=UPI000E32F969|nr:prephenate dehydrogenase/arogenate dehydrogenase family protein [Solimonas sp. K1W22B-7]AXQ29495.1 prephenate dehydrogenase/arogenate dehydrogenase family protein [Solimonas sp. K1W22B-7]